MRFLQVIRAIGVVAAIRAIGALTPAATAQSLTVAINRAIDRGVCKLLSQERADGSFEGMNADREKQQPMGQAALALYTLLKSGVPADDPLIKRTVEHLRYMKFEKTYGVGCLILALDALHDSNAETEDWIKRAAVWLESKFDAREKMWAYPEGNPELSNSQYASFGLYVASRHGFVVNRKIWGDVIQGVVGEQNNDGGFGYQPNDRPESGGTMTTAAIFVLTVAERDLTQHNETALARAARPALEKAWSWLDRNFTVTGDPAWTSGWLQDVHDGKVGGIFRHYYYLYGLERAAALADRKTIGDRPWYRDGAVVLLRQQDGNGGWGDLPDTCFALLFLRRATATGMEAADLGGFLAAENWRYTFQAPPAGWNAASFDDSSWTLGPSGFGNPGAEGVVVRTFWPEPLPDLWIRREFDWRGSDSGRCVLDVIDDDIAEVFVNGVLACERPVCTSNYVECEIRADALATLKPGRNLLAAHCKNTGGPRSLHVRVREKKPGASDEKPDEPGWWKTLPHADVPFIRRWRALGPLLDNDRELLNATIAPDEKEWPKEGDVDKNAVWRTVRSLPAVLDFDRALRVGDHCLFYSFTGLHVEREVDAVLWLGCDDGCRVLLDGHCVFSHPGLSAVNVDAHPTLLSLKPGDHRLLFKVHDEVGPSGLVARLCHKDGSRAIEIRPILAPGEDESALALADPSSFTPVELLKLLPLDKAPRRDFKNEGDLDYVAVGPATASAPRFVANGDAKELNPRPSPGGQGLLLMAPLGNDAPMRAWRHVKLAKNAGVFTVVASAAMLDPPGHTRAKLRLGVVARDEIEWLGEATIEGAQKPTPQGWQTVKADLARYSERDVLLVVECADAGTPGATLFVDEMGVR